MLEDSRFLVTLNLDSILLSTHSVKFIVRRLEVDAVHFKYFLVQIVLLRSIKRLMIKIKEKIFPYSTFSSMHDSLIKFKKENKLL